jgi:hypothetical protein
MLQVLGVQEEVQLREQDWCQQPESAMRCYNERLAYGRFFYRFPEGESAADVRLGDGRGREGEGLSAVCILYCQLAQLRAQLVQLHSSSHVPCSVVDTDGT